MTLIMSGVAGITTTLLLLLRRKKYNVSWIKMIVILLVVGIVGYIGAAFASFQSFGSWGGIRFYGKTLFVTLTLVVLSKILNIDCGRIMDYYAPVDIFALIVMKTNCLRAGCCAGIELSNKLVFPSQSVELATALLIFIAILILEKCNRYSGFRYSIYAIVYGATRFVFDALREEQGRMLYVGVASISVTQVFCVAIVVLSIICVFAEKRKNYKHVY